MSDKLYSKYLVINRDRLKPEHPDAIHPRVLDSAKAFLAYLELNDEGAKYFCVKSTDPKYQTVVDYVLNGAELEQQLSQQPQVTDEHEFQIATMIDDLYGEQGLLGGEVAEKICDYLRDALSPEQPEGG